MGDLEVAIVVGGRGPAVAQGHQRVGDRSPAGVAHRSGDASALRGGGERPLSGERVARGIPTRHRDPVGGLERQVRGGREGDLGPAPRQRAVDPLDGDPHRRLVHRLIESDRDLRVREDIVACRGHRHRRVGQADQEGHRRPGGVVRLVLHQDRGGVRSLGQSGEGIEPAGVDEPAAVHGHRAEEHPGPEVASRPLDRHRSAVEDRTRSRSSDRQGRGDGIDEERCLRRLLQRLGVGGVAGDGVDLEPPIAGSAEGDGRVNELAVWGGRVHILRPNAAGGAVVQGHPVRIGHAHRHLDLAAVVVCAHPGDMGGRRSRKYPASGDRDVINEHPRVVAFGLRAGLVLPFHPYGPGGHDHGHHPPPVAVRQRLRPRPGGRVAVTDVNAQVVGHLAGVIGIVCMGPIPER